MSTLSLSAFAQFKALLAQGLRAEWSDRERLVSPVLFAMTMLLLFSFALGDVDSSLRPKIFLAQTYLTALFALQLAFSRVFEPDRQDRVFDLLRSYPVSYTAWFLAKYALVLVIGAATMIPTMLFGAFLHQTANGPSLLSLELFAVAGLVLLGLASLGIMLSAMTAKAAARQILYPLIYFPLCVPVLMAAIQSSLMYVEAGGKLTEPVKAWASLLLAFDAIYVTLGILLFSELVDDA